MIRDKQTTDQCNIGEAKEDNNKYQISVHRQRLYYKCSCFYIYCVIGLLFHYRYYTSHFFNRRNHIIKSHSTVFPHNSLVTGGHHTKIHKSNKKFNLQNK